MSLDATRWAWQQDLRPSHKLVLLSLADRAGETHECFPSLIRLNKDTGLHNQTIMEAIHQLEQMGHIKVSRTDGKPNCYALIGVRCRTDADQYEKAHRFSDHPGKPTTPENRTGVVRKSGVLPPRKTEIPILESTIESTNESKTFSRQAAIRYLCDRGVPEQLASDWLAIRKSKKAVNTETAFSGIEKQARLAGMTMMAVIKTSAENNWAGFKANWMIEKDQRA